MTDAAQDEDSRKTYRRLGAVTLALGFLASSDSAYEITQFGLGRPGAGFEFILGQMAIVAGLALVQRRRRALELAVVAAVAGFFHSAIALAEIGSALLSFLTILGQNEASVLFAMYGIRLILTASQVLFWPILLGLLYIDLQCRSPEDPATRAGKRTYWVCVVAAGLFSTIAETFLRAVVQSS